MHHQGSRPGLCHGVVGRRKEVRVLQDLLVCKDSWACNFVLAAMLDDSFESLRNTSASWNMAIVASFQKLGKGWEVRMVKSNI